MRKGGKVQQKKSKGVKKTRSTRDEMCKKYDKQRNHLYYERRKVKKQGGKDDLSPAEISKLAKREHELNNKIALLSSKMFKCGKRYQKLLKKKRLLKSKEKKLLEDYKVDYSSMLSHQRSEAIKKIQKVSREIEDIEAVIKMPLQERTKDSKEKMIGSQYADFEEDADGDSINEPFGVWELTNAVSDKVRSGLFDYVSIDGEVFNVQNQSFELLRFCQELQSNIDTLRKTEKVSTPKFNMIVNLKNKTVRIWQ
jgi:hypothetical protein